MRIMKHTVKMIMRSLEYWRSLMNNIITVKMKVKVVIIRFYVVSLYHFFSGCSIRSITHIKRLLTDTVTENTPNI